MNCGCKQMVTDVADKKYPFESAKIRMHPRNKKDK